MTRRTTVDLSRFTNLETFLLDIRGGQSFERQFILLEDTLSSVSSHIISELSISFSTSAEDLPDLSVQLTTLQELDAMLAAPRYRNLYRIYLSLKIKIRSMCVQGLSIAPRASLPTLAVGTSSSTSSASQIPTVDGTSTIMLRNNESRFVQYAKDVIRLKILERLKQSNSRGKLDIFVSLSLWQATTAADNTLDEQTETTDA